MKPAPEIYKAGPTSSVLEVVVPVEERKYLSSKDATCPCYCGLADLGLAEPAVVVAGQLYSGALEDRKMADVKPNLRWQVKQTEDFWAKPAIDAMELVKGGRNAIA